MSSPVAANTQPSQALQSTVPPSTNPTNDEPDPSPPDTHDDRKLTLADIYNSGLHKPVVASVIQRLIGLDSILTIDQSISVIENSDSLLTSLRPSFPYSFSYDQPRGLRSQTTWPTQYARAAITALLVQDPQADVPHNKITQSFFYPVITVGTMLYQLPLISRNLSPISWEVRNVATSSFSKSLLTATSRYSNQTIYSPMITGIIGRMYLPYIMSPVTNYVPLLTRILLTIIHVMGPGTGEVSLSSSVFESGLPQQFTLHTVEPLCRLCKYTVHTYNAYVTDQLNQHIFSSALPPKLDVCATGARLLVTQQQVKSAWFPWLLLSISIGPQILFYETEPNRHHVEVLASGRVIPYQDGTYGDVLRLYNSFWLPGVSELDIVVIDATDTYEWPWINTRNLVHGGLYYPAVQDPQPTPNNPNVVVTRGIHQLFSMFMPDKLIEATTMLESLETLWNLCVTSWTTTAEIDTAIRFASLYATLYKPQSRIYAGADDSFSDVSYFTGPASINTMSNDQFPVAWEHHQEYDQHTCIQAIQSMTLPLGNCVYNYAIWNKQNATFHDRQSITGVLPVQNTDYISLDLMQAFEPTSTALFTSARYNIHTSVARTVNMSLGITSAVDFFSYLSTVTARTFCTDRFYDLSLAADQLAQLNKATDKLLGDIGGDAFRQLQDYRQMLRVRNNEDVYQFTPIPDIVPAQRVPYPMISHFCGVDFSRNGVQSLVPRSEGHLTFYDLRNQEGKPLLEGLAHSAPLRRNISEVPAALAAWYRDTICNIRTDNTTLAINEFQAVIDSTSRNPLSGVAYTYFSAALQSTFSVHIPVFEVNQRTVDYTFIEDSRVLQNLSLPIILSAVTGGGQPMQILSIDDSWTLIGSNPWATPYIHPIVSATATSLKRELKLGRKMEESVELFLA